MASDGGRRRSYITSGADSNNGGGVMSRVSSAISESPFFNKGGEAACEAAHSAKKLLQSTGRAAWIAGTTFLILVVPLIIEMDREQQLNELELQQASLLGTPPVGVGSAPN
ncbi:Mitochondrial import receptor subunit TOM9-2 [Ancistrocladus abbreviatus]